MGDSSVRPQCPGCVHSLVEVKGKWVHYMRRQDKLCKLHPGKTCDQVLRSMMK